MTSLTQTNDPKPNAHKGLNAKALIMAARLIPVLLLALTLVACGGEESLEEKKKRLAELKAEVNALENEIAEMDTTAKSERQKFVAATKLKPQLFKHYVDVEGAVESDNQAIVSTMMGGSVQQLKVKEGQYVGAGTVVAVIDHSTVDKQIQEIETRLELAKTDFERRKRLWEQKVGSEMQYLQAKNNYESLQNNLATLKEQRSKYFVTAPISGEVDEVFPKQGEFAGPGSPIVRIVGKGQYKLIANISEAFADKVKLGDQVMIDFPDLDKEMTGRIRQVGEQINPMTRTFEVEVTIDGSPKLKPNMIAFVSINDYTAKDAILIPRNIIRGRKSDNSYVYVAERRGDQYIAKEQKVELGKSYAESVEVLGGLKGGDIVVTTGFQELTPKTVLKIDRMLTQNPSKSPTGKLGSAVQTGKDAQADKKTPPKQVQKTAAK